MCSGGLASPFRLLLPLVFSPLPSLRLASSLDSCCGSIQLATVNGSSTSGFVPPSGGPQSSDLAGREQKTLSITVTGSQSQKQRGKVGDIRVSPRPTTKATHWSGPGRLRHHLPS